MLYIQYTYLSQGIGIGTHICENHQHVHSDFIGQILRGGKGNTGGNDTFDGWIVGQV